MNPARLEQRSRVGAYEIIRKLARGGMAELFLARGPRGLVVLKKILPRYAQHPRFVQLFLDEAKLAAGLAHPHIAKVYEAGNDRGTYFFAMEYLHGQDVRSILHRAWTYREHVPIEHAVDIVARVAAALEYAHERRRPDGTLLGLVHRDVSPSNILVAYDGTVKLVDFGVAKASTSSSKTRTGALKGKISYMSPEQAKGAAIDRRSDVFSLGIVLWELVTTQRLFRGDNDLQTLQLIIHEPPTPPSALRPECSPELERIILRALAQDPAQRYQTAGDLHRDLDELAPTQALDGPPESLAAYLAKLFEPEVRAWQDAQAAGRTLVEHLTAGGDLTIPLTESDFVEAIDLEAMLAADDDDDDGVDVSFDSVVDPSAIHSLATGDYDLDTELDADELTQVPTAQTRALRPVPSSAPVPAPARVAAAPSGGGVFAAAAPARAPSPALPPVALAGAGPSARPPWRSPSGAVPVLAVVPAIPPPAPTPPAFPIASAEMAAATSAQIATARAAGTGADGEGPPPTELVAPLPPPPGGYALDPDLADRLLRRGLWVTAAVVAAVFVVAIVAAIAA